MSESECDAYDLPKRERGLYGKYRVERVDGKGIDRCIVLELHDPNSWDALLTWANTVEVDGYVQLAADVRKWVITEQNIAKAHENVVERPSR